MASTNTWSVEVWRSSHKVSPAYCCITCDVYENSGNILQVIRMHTKQLWVGVREHPKPQVSGSHMRINCGSFIFFFSLSLIHILQFLQQCVWFPCEESANLSIVHVIVDAKRNCGLESPGAWAFVCESVPKRMILLQSGKDYRQQNFLLVLMKTRLKIIMHAWKLDKKMLAYVKE